MRILRYVLLPVLALAAAAFTIVVPSQATTPQYYVAIGDSLSKGYQPGLGDTNKGYVNDLYANLHATDPALQLVQLGCSGETTGTMINGGICTYPEGSQLKAAAAFLSLHAGQVKYLTLDIGANNVDGCATGGSIDAACVAQGLEAIGKDLATTILPTLTAADGRKPISVGMTYYDPFLAEYLGSTTGKAVAVASVPLAYSLNTELGAIFVANDFRVADVGGQFQTGNFAGRQLVLPYGVLPTNVADICKWTYMCSVNNIHANPTGYSVIAGVFARVIR